MSELKAVELWESYVGKGAPSNAAGGRTGLGWTQEQASEAAGHWANQAPWERFRKVVLMDHAVMAHYDDYRAWEALGYLEDMLAPSAAELEALAHLRAGRFASAWLTVFPPKNPK